MSPAEDRHRSGTRAALGVSVIIPARNRLSLLRYLLESLRCGQANPQEYEIIVVDDGSTDGTQQWLSRLRPACGWTVLRHDRPRGRGQARNAGLRVATGDVVLFLDADVLAPPTLVQAHQGTHAQWQTPCCVTGYPWFWRDLRTWCFPEDGGGTPGPLLDLALICQWPALERWAGGALVPPGAIMHLAPPDGAPFLWCVTRAISARRALLMDLGGFCERFIGYGLEDWELGYRMMRAGVDILSDPGAAVFHQAHPPADRGPHDLYRNYAVFLDLHPESEVALMPLVPPWAEQEAYARLCTGLAIVRREAPVLHAALEEAAIAFGRSWVEREGRAAPPMGWSSWAARWGPLRSRRILEEQVRMLRDVTARPALVAFQRIVGLERG